MMRISTPKTLRVLAWIFLSLLAATGFAEDATPEAASWRASGPYSPPDFDACFADSVPGAEALAAFWGARDRDTRDSGEVVNLLRQGLRRYPGDRAEVLRWFGRRFIERKSPPDTDAVEIMYHAVDSKAGEENRSLWRPAIRFGLASLRPMPPNVLRALADLSMVLEDPDDLDLIAWGINPQRDEALCTLRTYMSSENPDVLEKARGVAQIWKGEIEARDWARAQTRARATVAYGTEIPRFEALLRHGTSSERLAILKIIEDNDVMAILPDRAIDWFSASASDPDTEVRTRVARMVGKRWILDAECQQAPAIAILMTMSQDSEWAVQKDAVFYGLSAVASKEETTVERLLEVLASEPEETLRERILWGLRASQPVTRKLLVAWIASANPDQAFRGRVLYAELLGTNYRD